MQRYDTDRGELAVKILDRTSRDLSRSLTLYDVSDKAQQRARYQSYYTLPSSSRTYKKARAISTPATLVSL